MSHAAARSPSAPSSPCTATTPATASVAAIGKAIDGVLLGLLKRGEEPQTLSSDLLGIVKALSFYKKPRVALQAFDWFRRLDDSRSILTGPAIAVAVAVGLLGREGDVASALSLLQSLHDDGYSLDVFAYTSLISACLRKGGTGKLFLCLGRWL